MPELHQSYKDRFIIDSVVFKDATTSKHKYTQWFALLTYLYISLNPLLSCKESLLGLQEKAMLFRIFLKLLILRSLPKIGNGNSNTKTDTTNKKKIEYQYLKKI